MILSINEEQQELMIQEETNANDPEFPLYDKDYYRDGLAAE